MATQTGIDLAGLLRTLTSDYETARTEKQKRYAEGKGILEGVVEQFGPEYLKGEEKKQLAAMEQGMVGRGLGGTTRPAAVGTGIKADIRDRATKARTGAMTNVAQFMASFQDVYPQPGTLAHLATGGFSGLLQEELAKAAGGLGPGSDSVGMAGPGTRSISGGVGMAGPGTRLSGSGGGGGDGGGGVDTTGGRRTFPGPGVASATVGFGPSGGGVPATGAGAAAYGISGGGVTTPYEQRLAEEKQWRNPPSMPAGPGFTYTWIGGPDGHYTVSSTPGSKGEDVGVDRLDAMSDPNSPSSRYALGGYGGGF